MSSKIGDKQQPQAAPRIFSVWEISEPDSNGKKSKSPVSVSGRMPSSTDNKTWLTEAECDEYIENNGDKHSGQLRKAHVIVSPVVFIDVDKCVDSEGELSDFASELIETIGFNGMGAAEVARSVNGSLHVMLNLNADRSRVGFGRIEYNPPYDESCPQQAVEIFSYENGGRWRIIGDPVEGVEAGHSSAACVELFEHLVDQWDLEGKIARSKANYSLQTQLEKAPTDRHVVLDRIVKEDGCEFRVVEPVEPVDAAIQDLERYASEVDFLGDQWNQSTFRLLAYCYRRLSSTLAVEKINEIILGKIRAKADGSDQDKKFIAEVEKRMSSLWSNESQRLDPLNFTTVSKSTVLQYRYEGDTRWNDAAGVCNATGTVEEQITSAMRSINGEFNSEEIAAEVEEVLAMIDPMGATAGAQYDYSQWHESSCMIGRLFRHFMGKSGEQNESLALAKALTMLSSIAVGKVACSDGTLEAFNEDLSDGIKITLENVTHPQLSWLVMGSTGTGKSGFKKVTDAALKLAGLRERANHNSLSSGQAVYRQVSECPTAVFCVDEVGSTVFPDHRSALSDGIITALKDITTAGGKDTEARSLANKGHEIFAEGMAPTTILLTQTEVAYSRISNENMGDGFLGRFIAVELDKSPRVDHRGKQRTRSRADSSLPEFFSEWLKSWGYSIGEEVLAGSLKHDGRIGHIDLDEVIRNGLFHYTFDAIAVYQEFRNKTRDLVDSLEEQQHPIHYVWGRVKEKITALATLFAFADPRNEMSSEVKLIEVEHVMKAIEFLSFTINRSKARLDSRVTTQEAQLAQEIIRICNETAPKGGGLGHVPSRITRGAMFKNVNTNVIDQAFRKAMSNGMVFKLAVGKRGSIRFYGYEQYHKMVAKDGEALGKTPAEIKESKEIVSLYSIKKGA